MKTPLELSKEMSTYDPSAPWTITFDGPDKRPLSSGEQIGEALMALRRAKCIRKMTEVEIV